MATRYTDGSRRDAVRIAVTSGLTRPQASSDLGFAATLKAKSFPEAARSIF